MYYVLYSTVPVSSLYYTSSLLQTARATEAERPQSHRERVLDRPRLRQEPSRHEFPQLREGGVQPEQPLRQE